MALIDELKERRERQTESLATIYEAIRERQEYLRGVEFELEDLDRAIAALEAPLQPHDAVRDAPPAASENAGVLIRTGTNWDIHNTELATSEPNSGSSSGSIHDRLQGEGVFEPPPGRVEESRDKITDEMRPCTCHPDDAPLECMNRYAASECHKAYSAKYFLEPTQEADEETNIDRWMTQDEAEKAAQTIDDKVQYAPATPGHDEADPASDALGDDGEVVTSTDTGIELTPDSVVTIVANEPPTQSLWLQGYNDKLNGFEPSLSETDYLSGYEARAMIEREQDEGSTARMFAQGMMADADRHQSDQRSIVEKIGGLFKREREDA